jgi:hypothetical protein
MLIQQLIRARLALLVARAFGLGAAEPGAIGLCLLGSLLALNALFEPLEID